MAMTPPPPGMGAPDPMAQAPMQESPAEESQEHKELVNLTKQVTTLGSVLQRLVTMVEDLSSKMAQDQKMDASETNAPEGPGESEAQSAPTPAPSPAPRTSMPPTGGPGGMPQGGAPKIALPGGL